MATVPRPDLENPTSGLVLLPDEQTVAVTGEEDHQDTLAGYAPRGNGQVRRFAAELRFAPIRHGRNTGQRGIEVLIDGRRVGELPDRTAQHYSRMVLHVRATQGRPGCLARVVEGPGADGRTLLGVQLRLPRDPSAALQQPTGADAPTTVAAAPAAAAGRGSRRRPLWIAGGVGAVLIAVGATVGIVLSGQQAAPPLVTGPRAAPTATAPVATTPAPTTPEATTAPAEVAPATPAPTRRRTSAAVARTTTARATAPARTTTTESEKSASADDEKSSTSSKKSASEECDAESADCTTP